LFGVFNIFPPTEILEVIIWLVLISIFCASMNLRC
jgi:hypothetical protein